MKTGSFRNLSRMTSSRIIDDIPASILTNINERAPDGYSVEEHYSDFFNNITVIVISFVRDGSCVRLTMKYRSHAQSRIETRRGWTNFTGVSNIENSKMTENDEGEIHIETNGDQPVNLSTKVEEESGDWQFGDDFLSLAKNMKEIADHDSDDGQFKIDGLEKYINAKLTLMLSEIDPDYCRQETIRDMCEPFGKTRKVSIVTYKRGRNKDHPTGRVFVDFFTRQSLLAAIEKLNGSVVGYTFIKAEEPKGRSK